MSSLCGLADATIANLQTELTSQAQKNLRKTDHFSVARTEYESNQEDDGIESDFVLTPHVDLGNPEAFAKNS